MKIWAYFSIFKTDIEVSMIKLKVIIRKWICWVKDAHFGNYYVQK